MSPLDEEWLLALTPANRDTLLEHALPVAEALAIPIHDACRFLDTHLELIPQSGGGAWSALGALAIVRGDAEAARRIEAFSIAQDAARGIAGSRALIEGRLDDAIAVFENDGAKAPALLGLARLLHAYALVARGQVADLEAAGRVVAQRGRGRGEPMKQAISHQKALVEYARKSSELPAFVYQAALATDGYSALVRAHFALWFDAPDFEVIHSLHTAHELAEACDLAGNTWLRDQYRGVAHALFERRSGTSGEKTAIVPPPPPPVKMKLWEILQRKAPWETALAGIEQLSRRAMDGGERGVEETERIIWRVRQFGRHFNVEPFLQKWSRGAYTKGRSLALKHLAGDETSARLRLLPEEDRRIAAHVRVRRDSYGGYPEVRHFFATEVLRALVGHPRVFLEDSSDPIEVGLGSAQVIARAKDGRSGEIEFTIEPPDLFEPVEMRLEAHRLVVYELAEPVRALAKIVGSGLTLPEAARQRAMDALGGLSHLVAVQSSAGGTGRSVPADAKPWLRLVPRGMSIAVSARVRPLGKEGPEVAPGRGAPTLVARVGGETLAATRDLALERMLAARAFEACALLEADAEEHTDSARRWQGVTPDDPESALVFLSRLRELGDGVHTEWPEGTPLRLRPKVGRRRLRGTLSSGVDFFLAAGSLELGEDLHLDLEELLALVAARPGRFVELASGEYLELEQDLRELLDSVAAARLDERPGKRRGIALPRTAVAVLERLLQDGQGLTPDAGAGAFRERLLDVAQKQYPIPRALQAELRPYQAEGFQWLCRLAELELGACLADDMGLGKTVQLIALLLHRCNEGPALVVAPTSVCENWRRELSRFAPSLEVRLYVGSGRANLLDELTKGTVVVTSYAILQQDAEALAAPEFASVVLDEAQLVKNAESQRARAAFGLRGRFRAVSTGTPVENHVGDLHSLFRFALPGLLGTYSMFNRRFGKDLIGEAGAPARRALRRLVQPFILRRTKAEVLDDLPPLTEIQHSVELGPEEARLYEAVRRNALTRLAEATDDPRARLQVLAEVTRLRRLCCHPALAVDAPGAESSKIAAFMELVSELVEARHRALVFSQFVDILALVRTALDAKGITYQYLDGSTKPKARTAAVDAFQQGEGDVFLISLRAGGFGLNLTGADYVIHLDPWWNPAVESQASDRAHRIGQTRPVTVYRLIAAGTIEERIMELHRKKRHLADSLLDDTGRSATLSVEELRSLLGGERGD